MQTSQGVTHIRIENHSKETSDPPKSHKGSNYMKFRNLHIGTRLGLGFGLILLLLVVLAVASLSRMSSIHASLDEVINENNVIVKELGEMRQAVMQIGVSVSRASCVGDDCGR